jgi:hypothetical protein
MFRKLGLPLALLLALSLHPTLATASPLAGRDKEGQETAQLEERGVFVERCRFSHEAPDDPIVAPGLPGASHMHTFFGNTTTNADSTLESLRAAGTTCITAGDTSGYWVPTLTQNGVAVKPRSITVYYRMGPNRDEATIQAFPPGFRVVAGDAKASAPQVAGLQQPISWWSCRGEMERSLTPLACEPGQMLNLHVRFPQCWDGVNLDSADHRSHMAYLSRGACPESHPIRVPALTAISHYAASGDPSTIALSSGGIYSGHADFFNAWDQSVLESKVAECLNAQVRCRPNPFRG